MSDEKPATPPQQPSTPSQPTTNPSQQPTSIPTPPVPPPTQIPFDGDVKHYPLPPKPTDTTKSM